MNDDLTNNIPVLNELISKGDPLTADKQEQLRDEIQAILTRHASLATEEILDAIKSQSETD